MKYFILDKRTNSITSYQGGYKTRQYASTWGIRSFNCSLFNDGLQYARSLSLSPGIAFSSGVDEFMAINSEIIEVEEIIYKTTDGRQFLVRV